ncbi:MAG TPA: hypothetical protein VHU84_17160 [Lacipirellulaceae bacterium]|jgi:hypothetical protein|nr:hypothetical protein [Lacipirellulaceae bacterium]
MRKRLSALFAPAIIFIAFSAHDTLALTLNPVATGGVYENAPYDGNADGKESAPFIASINNHREDAVYEFDLTGNMAGLLQSATLTGSIVPNNSSNTGTRIDNIDIYTGNGAIDLADYSAASTRVGSVSHPSGGSSTYNLDIKSALQNLLTAGATKIGVRVSPGADPQGYDVLQTSANPPQLNFSLLPTGSTTVQKQPLVDAQATLGSSTYSITDGDTSINVQKVDSISLDRRAILEFNIADIPVGANITSAHLDLDLTVLGSSPPTYPSLPIYGYAGNGTAEPADATRTATKIAQSDPITSLDPISIDLDMNYVKSLLGTGSKLGLLIVGSATKDGVSFATTESTGFAKPSLSITYLPPVAGDYDGNGTVGPEDYTVWRSHFGATGVSAADGNGNGVVDAADYVVWRSHLGNSASASAASASTAVPEPSTILILAAAVLPLTTRFKSTSPALKPHPSLAV